MKEPTTEQINRIWEWCGLTHAINEISHNNIKVDMDCWFRDGHTNDFNYFIGFSIDLTLDNLFGYAMPKLRRKYNVELQQLVPFPDFYIAKIWDNLNPNYSGRGQDKYPALALFWAIWEVINAKDNI